MSIKVNLPGSNSASDSICHHIPCRIDYRGSSNISKYFSPNIRRHSDATVTSSFRGRPLHGKDVKIPSGCVGVILAERPSLLSDVRNLNMKGSFKTLTLWNWDQTPSSLDKLQQALDWIEIASSVHVDLSTDYIAEENCTQSQNSAVIVRK